MVWFFIIINFYFDYVVALMLGALLAYLAAKAAVHLRFLETYVIMNRILAYIFLLSFTLLLCVTFVVTKTDPDFSVTQRYRQAFDTVRGWIWKHDPRLEKGGLEQALRMQTHWVVSPEQVFFTRGGELYSIFTDGQQQSRHFSADDVIQQAMFSPNGKYLAVKTSKSLTIVDALSDHVQTAYGIPQDKVVAGNVKIRIGGIQWSPDNRKVCFFVHKTSAAASHTNWFVYDLAGDKTDALNLGSYQDVFLSWASDSQRLYFFQTRSAPNQQQAEYRVRWFEIPLASGQISSVVDIFSASVHIADDVLLREGIKVYRPDSRLRFESRQVFNRNTAVVSSVGRKLFVNKDLQLCYQSAYGVRYRLFGLALLEDYATFFPKARASELLIQDVRWLPSEKYVLIRHYTHGLLVLQPLAREIGVLAEGDIGLFGVYPR